MVARLAERGLPVTLACRLLEVSHSGFYEWRSRPSSPAALRREWLTGVITEIHARSRGTYGAPRVRAELRLGMGIMVTCKTVAKLMKAAGLAGIPRRQTRKNPKVEVTSADLVNRNFLRTQPNVVGLRYCRTSHAGRETVLLRGLGCVQPQNRRLVHRRHPEHHPCRQRPGHGDRQP